MDYFSIGKFTINAELLALVLAIFLISVLYRTLFKSPLLDWYWNSFLLLVAVYKGSYVLFHFSLFLNNPMSIIYFNGGWRGLSLAFGAVILYLLSIKKQSSIQQQFLPAYLLFFITYYGLKQVFLGSFLASAFYLIVLLALFVFLKFDNKIDGKNSNKVFIIFLLLITMLISIFNDLLKLEPVLMIMTGIIMIALNNQKKEK